MVKKTLKLGELFCGPGGLAAGAVAAKVKKDQQELTISHVWASDYHAETCETYKLNFPNSDVICEDVRQLEIEKLQPIDLFAYGFPCNDFSNVGEKKGVNGEFGPLYTYGVEVLDTFNPKAFLAENVGGITSANDGKAFLQILQDLQAAGKHGYSLTVHKYKFEEYGIPQCRHRIIIVGIRNDLNIKFRVPKPTHENNFMSAKVALTVPPITDSLANNEPTKQSKTVIERLSYIKPGENIWQTELPKHLQLNVKGAKLSQIYRRLHPDKPSYTITGSGGGGTHGYHWVENRALTNRERARLQTFPDDFIFVGGKESVRRQIGMAVSPSMAKILFTALLNSLAGIEYDSVPPNLQKYLEYDRGDLDRNTTLELIEESK